jgi:polyisoprenoid-binding protein YceI
MRNPAFIFVTIMAVSSLAQAENVAFQVDPAHSSVGFVVRHMAITNVRGTFGEFTGSIQADKETGKPSAIEGTVQVKSIDTGIGKRDDHLRSPDFFDVAKFPTMTLKTKSITYSGNEFTALAELTIKGITKEVTLKGEYLGARKGDMGMGAQLHAGISASTKINRQDFGLKWNMLVEGTGVVADEVRIELEAEILRPLK